MIRVAFVLNLTDKEWAGGVNYFRNLLWTIHNLQSSRLLPILFVGKQTSSSQLKDFPPIEVVRTQALDRKAPLWWFRGIFLKLLGRDVILERVFARENIEVVSHRTGMLPKLGLKSIGWIPDFQHLHYPEFFDDVELNKRNKEFKLLANRSSAVILSSAHAQNDFKGFISDPEKKSYVLNFAIPHRTSEINTDIEELRRNYQIQEKYFYLPNQFWAHKNHRVVIDALVVLKRERSDLMVVSTGKIEDHRAPKYFSELMEYAREVGVSENFKVLGAVPYKHILPLMKNAVAVINPSLFEGWSTTVEEAKSLGKRTLLSDIEVHREQNPVRGVYFNPTSPSELVVLMKSVLEAFNPAEENVQSVEAKEKYSENFLNFGKNYEKIVLDVVGNHY